MIRALTCFCAFIALSASSPLLRDSYGLPIVNVDNQYSVPQVIVPSTSYGVPIAPSNTYGVPAPVVPVLHNSYHFDVPAAPVQAPVSIYGPPTPLKVPASVYGTPAVFNVPSSVYGTPARSPGFYDTPAVVNAPSPVYGAPTVLKAPSPVYGAPTVLKAPSPIYGPPAETYVIPSKPANTYGPPAEVYGPPAKPSEVYGPPPTPLKVYGAPVEKVGAPIKTEIEYTIPHAASTERGPAPAAYSGLYGTPSGTIGSVQLPSSASSIPLVNNEFFQGSPAESSPVPQQPSNDYGLPQ